MVIRISGVSSILRNVKKEDATWSVHCVYVGARGSLMYFEIENKEDNYDVCEISIVKVAFGVSQHFF